MKKTQVFQFLAAVTIATLSANPVHSQNPLHFGSKIFTADPSAHVWKDGKMYVYTSHDEECQTDFFMKD